MKKKTIAIRHYKVGYEIRTERVKMPDCPVIVIKSAYTPSGDYIGDAHMARFLVKEKGIAPEKAQPKHNVCSIGYSKEKKKWYGWSHRAITGFSVKTHDARQKAKTFAKSVS